MDGPQLRRGQPSDVRAHRRRCARRGADQARGLSRVRSGQDHGLGSVPRRRPSRGRAGHLAGHRGARPRPRWRQADRLHRARGLRQRHHRAVARCRARAGPRRRQERGRSHQHLPRRGRGAHRQPRQAAAAGRLDDLVRGPGSPHAARSRRGGAPRAAGVRQHHAGRAGGRAPARDRHRGPHPDARAVRTHPAADLGGGLGRLTRASGGRPRHIQR